MKTNVPVRFLKTPVGFIGTVVIIGAAAAYSLWFLSIRSADSDLSSAFAARAARHGTNGAAAAQPTSVVNLIRPTVTPDMPDLGGKYFGQTPDPAHTKHYYIAAESEKWDFMPNSSDVICGMTVPSAVRKGHQSWKTRYIQYTDGTFTERVPQPASLGILGPVLRAEVGDYIAVTFLNRAKLGGVFSMHPHGLKYDKDSEGSYHGGLADPLVKSPDGSGTAAFDGRGAAIDHGARFTYVWYCDASSGPSSSEPSSKGWLYHSHVTTASEINLGLVGFIIVTDPKRARPDGTPNDVDRELAALFLIFDESNGGDNDDIVQGNNTGATVFSPNMKEQGERYAINGRVFDNLPGLEMNEGERVRWYVFGLGSEVDLHTAHWHGARVVEDGRRTTDVVELLPASMKVADMVADNPGSWLFHCHVEEHMGGGMFARMTVHPKGQTGVSTAPEKAFFGLQMAGK